jgi:CheY-like chemotaxis protein
MAVPVILMTAYAAALDPERIRQAGFHALLPKPLDFGRLAQLLQDIRGAAAAGSDCA